MLGFEFAFHLHGMGQKVKKQGKQVKRMNTKKKKINPRTPATKILAESFVGYRRFHVT